MVELETLSLPTFAPDKPVRPPTPPREASVEEPRSGALKRVFGLFRRTSSISTTVTPQSSAESPVTSSNSIRKRVGWKEDLEDCIVPTSTVKGSDIFSSPSVERKTPKSILKSNPHNVSENAFGSLSRSNTTGPHATSFAIMLESTTQQLAGTDRSAKVDAYLTLSRALKASDNVPDIKALKNKMDLFLSFIKRDLTEKTDDSKPESSLVVNALVLLCSFFHTTTIAEIIPSDFASYIVDHSIKTFEDPQASKDAARHLLFIMAKQNFSTKVMSQERVGRLVKSLHNIESGNLTGKRIVDGRINIYRTLIRQTRSHMLANHLWIQDLFTDMTSNLKETRTHAITFGLEAAFSFGMEVKMTKAVSMLFETKVEEKEKYGSMFITRLKQMLQKENEKDPSSATAVPQIWSVIVLFFQGRIRLLQQWEFLADWLKVISDSFNQSDASARKEALVAWNRFIFVVYSNEQTSVSSTTSNLTKLLPQALERQLRRENLRTQSLNTLCCLLYYSSKSATTPAQTDIYWNEHVARLVGSGLIPADVTSNPKKVKPALTDACSVLQWLFDHATARTYNEKRILDNDFPVNELLPLDPKWLRKSALIVFPVLGRLLEKLYWELGEKSDVNLLWQTYVKSISSPAIKEIKVANDTMTSIASIFGFLHKIWNAGPKALNSFPRQRNGTSDSVAFLKSFDQLVVTLLNGLGHLPFTERQLSIGTSDTFLPVATPSQRPGKLRGQVKSPFHHLVTLLATPSPNLEYDQAFARVVQHILAPFFECRRTKASQIELAKSLLEILPAENTESCRIIWQVIANITTSVVDTRDTENSGPRDQPLGAGYKDLVKILDFGIGLARNEPLPGWKSLFDAITCSSILDAGDAGKAIAVIEPLAALLLKKDPPVNPLSRLLYLNILIGKASYPKDRQALDAASKKLWGAAMNGQKGASFDPFVRLYELCQSCLEASYASFEKQRLHDYVDMVTAMASLLSRCPPVLCFAVLACLQSGIGLWVQNANAVFSSGDKISVAVMSLLNKTLDIVSRLLDSHDHSKLLSEFEILLCSGLESNQKNTINMTIKFWNSSFGISRQELQYPVHLKNTLLRLRAITDIELPSLPTSLLSEQVVDERQLMDFEESQFDPGSLFSTSGLSSSLKVLQGSRLVLSPTRRIHEVTPQVVLKNPSVKRSREETPDLRGRKTRKREITPRLRHDDSQVQFQPIDSSPIVDRAIDSQVLTDRQKEVKERQLADAAMFHNIGSSPLRRSRSAEEADPELPIHISSSQLRSESRERRPTPTLVTPSDDDGFVASSPTPTRSIRGEVDEDGPPSSPPESSRELVEMEFDNDIPSSPLEQSHELEVDFSGSFGPSAQIDPDAILQDVAISTYGSTIDYNGVLNTPQAAGIEDIAGEQPGAEVESDIQVEINNQPQFRVTRARSSRMHQSAEEVEETILESPATPKHQPKTPVASTPKTPYEAFVDARGSPTSSDKLDGDDDVFEDAVSSPRLHIERPLVEVVSSSLSDLDESSIMRALAEAEGQGQNSLGVSSSDKENPSQKSNRSVSEQPSLSKSRVSSRKAYLMRKEEIGHGKDTMSSKPQSSSFPSHIPETPAPSALPISAKIMIGNQALSPDDTIFVDDSELYEEVETSKSGGRIKRKAVMIPSRKRKLDNTEDQDSVADNQDISREGSSQPSQVSVKRGRGRPRKQAQPSQEFDTSIDLGRSQSLVSIASMEEEEAKSPPQDMDIVENAEVLSALPKNEVVVVSEDVGVREEGLEGAKQVPERSRDTSVVNSPVRVTMSFDVIGETTVEGSSFLDASPFGSGNSASNAEPNVETSREVIAASTNVAVTRPDVAPNEEASMQIIEETRIMSQPPAPTTRTIQSVKEQLQTLMSTLGTAALTRGEVNEIEDLLMDTKELLYGAARRGRNS